MLLAYCRPRAAPAFALCPDASQCACCWSCRRGGAPRRRSRAPPRANSGRPRRGTARAPEGMIEEGGGGGGVLWARQGMRKGRKTRHRWQWR
eukprot:6186375-Pleurochrysis_carterae.AAC.1